MKMLRVLAVVLLVACIVGCGGGGGKVTSTKAAAMFSIEWPVRSGATPPTTAASIEVALSGRENLPAPSVVNRSAGTGAVTLPCAFANLPPGKVIYTITAYSQADKGGTVVGRAFGTVTLTAGQTATTAVSAVLNGAIDSFTLDSSTGTALNTGDTSQLALTAQDAQHRLVLLTPGAQTWTSANGATASVDDAGFLIARAGGSVAITVQDTPSAKSASLTFSITGPTVIASTTTEVDNTGGTVAVANIADAPAITIPAGMLADDAKVTVSALAATPIPPANTDAELVGTPVAIAISGAEVNKETNIILSSTVADDPNKMTLMGYEHDGKWTVAPATGNGVDVTAQLPIQPATTVTKGRSRYFVVDDILGLAFIITTVHMVITRNYSEPPMKVYYYSATDPKRWLDAGTNAWKTTETRRVALMVHGLGQSMKQDKYGNNTSTFDALAAKLGALKKYDAIYAVDYLTGYGIDAQGNKLATIIKDRVTAGKIDIYAHSMGGLVSRSAIELHGAADKVDLLVTMGTPHFGVTASVIASLAVNYCNIFGIDFSQKQFVQELADMFPFSPFLISLNIPSNTTCTYRALVGTDMNKSYEYDNDFAWALIPSHDGMVESYSAGFDLSSECANYGQKLISLNHDSITKDTLALDTIMGWYDVPPTLTLTASSNAVTPNGRVTLTWSSVNANAVLSSNFGATGVSGSVSVTVPYATVFYISVSGRAGSVYKQVTINTSSGAGYYASMINRKTGAVMMTIPTGTYPMGSPTDVGKPDEAPAFSVKHYLYSISRTEVTVAQYRRFARETGRAMPPFTETTFLEKFAGWQDPKLDEYPMVHVTWNDAQAYADWAGLKLPTEAQWEVAARGTNNRNYPWGGTATVDDPFNGWDQNKCSNSWNSGPDFHPVCSFPAGASWCGVQDMAGSVSEWCRSWYADSWYGDMSAISVKNGYVVEPQGPPFGSLKVVRGGSIGSSKVECRSAAREAYPPNSRMNIVGFRVVESTY